MSAIALVEFGIVAHHAAAEIGLDRAGSDRVDRDAARAELFGQVAGQHLDRALHRGVGAVPGVVKRVRPVEMLTIRPPLSTSGRSFCVRKNTPLR